MKLLKKESLQSLWESAIKFCRMMIVSKNVNTQLWLLELLFLLSVKFTPKELLSSGKLRKTLHQLINDLLGSIALHACDKIRVLYNDNNPKQGGQGSRYRQVFPLTPTIYALYRARQDAKNNKKDSSHTNDDQDYETDNLIREAMFDFKTDRSHRSRIIKLKYQIYSFETLTRIGLRLLQNTYSSDRTKDVVSYVTPLPNPRPTIS